MKTLTIRRMMTTLFAAAIVLGTTGAAFAADRDGRDHRDGDRRDRVVYVAPPRHDDHVVYVNRDRHDDCRPGFQLNIDLGGRR